MNTSFKQFIAIKPPQLTLISADKMLGISI